MEALHNVGTNSNITLATAEDILARYPDVEASEKLAFFEFLKAGKPVDLAMLNSGHGNRDKIDQVKRDNGDHFRQSYIGFIIFSSIALAVVLGCILLWDYGG